MRIAIVGSGVSGLVAAHRLRAEHEVAVFEAGDHVGGHVHTVPVSIGSLTWHVDTGFIVFNRENYPGFSSLLDELRVPSQPTSMSFSVRDDAANLEYNGSSFAQLFTQRRNLARPAFYGMLRDILRFNREAPAAAADGAAGTLGDWLAEGRFGEAFIRHYLVPMGSALWSLPAVAVREMPLAFFVRFFENHGMLTVDRRPQWRVVTGGSRRYVEALTAPFRDRIRLRTPVRRVVRLADGVLVNGEPFDRVVLACHSDQALAVLVDPSPREREILGALPYQANDVLLHTDTSILPRRRRAWGSWNYRVRRDPERPAAVTYHMNELQSLLAPRTFCVSLNADDLVDPARVLYRVRYHHPVMSLAGARAQARRGEISGHARTHFCGAYWGYGFHEDGVRSALAVVDEIASAAGIPVAA
jgi:predicted NAD/FAD-binding protein